MNGITSRNSHNSGIAIRFLLSALVTTVAAMAANWETGIVDGSRGGLYSSLRFDKYGNGHVSYVDSSGNVLQYSFWDHKLGKWFSTTIDYADGFCALALDSKQYPHISYNINSQLKHAYWDGVSWQKQTIPVRSKELSWYTSISLDSGDNPAISFYEVHNVMGQQVARLRVVMWTGQVWALMTADPTYGSGKFNSIVFDSTGKLNVAYGNVIYENSSLRYARWDGASWNNEILEGAGVAGTYRQAVAMILDKSDVPHIAFSDVNHGIVKYAAKVAGKWQIEAVDSIGKVGYPDRNGIALDAQGVPYVSYYDAKSGVLKLAHRQDNKWFSETVDSEFAGFTSSLQICDDTIWLTYSPGNTFGLKFAHRRLESDAAAARPINQSVLR